MDTKKQYLSVEQAMVENKCYAVLGLTMTGYSWFGK